MAVNDKKVDAVLARGAAECQERHTQSEDKCHDTNAKENQWCDDGRGCGDSGNAYAATGGGEKTQHSQPHATNKQNLHLHQDEDVCYKLVPPDGGWGWMVVLGTFIIVMLLPTVGPCFGVLFSEYLLGAGASSTTTAWIFNLQCFLWFISGLFTRPLTQEFGLRSVGVTGSLMGGVGLMLSAFTPNIGFLFFSFSFMTGIGGGMVTCQCFTILPHYFQRLRGFTNAIMMCGICFGQIVMPPVARYLQDNYGFRGATLIIGALMLNSCIGASFFHPFEWHQKKVRVERLEEHVPILPTITKPTESPLIRELDGWRPRLSSSRQTSRYNSTLSLSSMDVGSFAALPMDDEQDKAQTKAEEAQDDIFPIRVVKSTMKDLAVLKSFRACIICFGGVMCINGFLNYLMMVPFAILEAGFSKDTSAWGGSVSAGCNLVIRFVVSVLSDFPRFNVRLAYMTGFGLVASCITAFTFLNTAEWLLAAMAVYGVGVGACMGIYNIVIIDVMGLERLLSVFGASNFCVAIGFIIIGPIIGFVRDMTQSYAVSMRITAGMLMLGLLAWMFMGVAERIDRRREEAEKMKEEP